MMEVGGTWNGMVRYWCSVSRYLRKFCVSILNRGWHKYGMASGRELLGVVMFLNFMMEESLDLHRDLWGSSKLLHCLYSAYSSTGWNRLVLRSLLRLKALFVG